MSEIPPITDSPWFWTLVYTSVPLVALTLLSHKYATRQAHIEWRYQSSARAIEKSAAEQAIADAGPNPTAIDPQARPAQRPFSSPEDTIISVVPLAILFFFIECVAAAMLTRERRKLRNSRAHRATLPAISTPP